MALGNLENPFGRSGGPPPRPNERAHGPFPGDETVYTFEVFTDRELTASIGSAVFTCTYSFARTALCDAAYRLRDGQLIGAGTLGFDAPGFTLALTGGTGAYRGSSGELKATSTPGGGQRLRLVLD